MGCSVVQVYRRHCEMRGSDSGTSKGSPSVTLRGWNEMTVCGPWYGTAFCLAIRLNACATSEVSFLEGIWTGKTEENEIVCGFCLEVVQPIIRGEDSQGQWPCMKHIMALGGLAHVVPGIQSNRYYSCDSSCIASCSRCP
jgi:hypothetical protein